MDKELLTVIYYAITSILLWTDITRLLLPYKLTALLISVGLLYACFNQCLINHLFGLLFGVSIFFIIYIVSFWVYQQEGLGLGDILLSAGIGAFWGLNHVIYTIYASCIMSGCVALILLLFTSKTKQDAIPFGPFLILSSWGTHLFQIYLDNVL